MLVLMEHQWSPFLCLPSQTPPGSGLSKPFSMDSREFRVAGESPVSVASGEVTVVSAAMFGREERAVSMPPTQQQEGLNC